jgi:hypothetical protein
LKASRNSQATTCAVAEMGEGRSLRCIPSSPSRIPSRREVGGRHFSHAPRRDMVVLSRCSKFVVWAVRRHVRSHTRTSCRRRARAEHHRSPSAPLIKRRAETTVRTPALRPAVVAAWCKDARRYVARRFAATCTLARGARRHRATLISRNSGVRRGACSDPRTPEVPSPCSPGTLRRVITRRLRPLGREAHGAVLSVYRDRKRAGEQPSRVDPTAPAA